MLPDWISAEAVLQRIWRFSRGDGSVIARQIRLAANGRLIGYANPNETTWRWTDDGLEFLDAHGAVTTRFDELVQDAAGSCSMQGRFLGTGAHDVVHVLTELPRPWRPPNRPRIAVLVRTHLVTDKLLDLLETLKRGIGYDLFVCADETRGALPLHGEAVVAHSVAMCAEIGLLAPPDGVFLEPLNRHPERLLWYFGDYAFYCAQYCIPDYEYYAMIEYDVEFVRGNSLALEGLLNRIADSPDGPWDLVAAHYGTRPPEWGWSATCEGIFDQVYGVLLPLVVLSKRAISYLYDWRRREAAHPPADGRFVFCEAFVPSALNAAGGFRCADLATLIPGSWDPQTFRVGAPMLLGALPSLKRGIEVVHPVFSEREFLPSRLEYALNTDTLEEFVTLLSDPDALPLTPDLRRAFHQEALQHRRPRRKKPPQQ